MPLKLIDKEEIMPFIKALKKPVIELDGPKGTWITLRIFIAPNEIGNCNMAFIFQDQYTYSWIRIYQSKYLILPLAFYSTGFKTQAEGKKFYYFLFTKKLENLNMKYSFEFAQEINANKEFFLNLGKDLKNPLIWI